MNDVLAAAPVDLGWGLILALIVRGLMSQLPRIVEAVSRGLVEREAAKRITAQTKLTEAETEQADHAERRALLERVDGLEQRLREQEATAAHEIESAHALHRITADKLEALASQHAKCTSLVAAMRAEIDTVRAEMRAGHTPR